MVSPAWLFLTGIAALLAVDGVKADKGYDERWPSDFSAEGVLIKNLLEGYNKRAGKYARPVFNHTHAVPVRLMLQLIQIIDLDEKNQVLKLNLWTNYYWIDEFLRWNPDDYAGVSEIRIPSDLIWTPDIKLYNYADTRKDERRDALCVLSYDGNINWSPQGIYMSSCEINVNTFPFDKQTCHLKFGSWTHDGSKLNLSFYGEKEQMITDDYFVPNKAWTVLEAPGKRTVQMYTCCPSPYIDITYTVVFRRSATFYTYILIVPCVLLTTLTLVLYWIPPESPTKMALGMSIFMAFFVLLLLFEGNMPPASEDVPILGTYYCLNMVLITTSTFLNVFVVNLSFYGSRAAIPKLMKTVMFEYVARILCMDNLVRPFLEADKKRLIPVAIPGLGLVNGGNGKFQKNWKGSTELLSNRKDELQIDPQLAEIDSKLADVKEFIAAYFERLDDKDRREKLAKEWKAVGLIFDRLFFWIYLVTILTSLSVVLSVIFMGS